LQLRISSRNGSSGRAVSESKRAPQAGQEKWRISTSGCVEEVEPGISITRVLVKAAADFQEVPAGAIDFLHSAQQMQAFKMIRVRD
jgi:hypothetical protein